MNVLAGIMQVVTTADAVLGSETGKLVMAFLQREKGLTPEQRKNLDDNYADYQQRIGRLKAELGD